MTNILVNKCIKHLENHLKKTNIVLPLPAYKTVKICILCLKHYFQFDGIFIYNYLINP